MSFRSQEHQHNTPEQVREYLQGAADIVEALDIPPDLVPVAFEKAIDLMSAKQVVLEQVGIGLGLVGPNQH